MKLIKNYRELSTDKGREIGLKILEAGLEAISPEKILREHVRVTGNILTLKKKRVNLDKYERLFLVGFGKGSAGIAQFLEKKLLKRITSGFVIDTVAVSFEKMDFVKGTHPLPSAVNVEFTEKVLRELNGLTKKDLVLVVICGGGSALFESPGVGLSEIKEINDRLINSGAAISEINIARKHLSKVKGGGLAKHLYPAKVINLVFSDVPGNDLSTIASGPTVRDSSSVNRAKNIFKRHGVILSSELEAALTETPKEQIYFENVDSVLMLSNMDALQAMHEKADSLGYKSFIFSDRIEGDAKKIGRRLMDQTPPGKILLAGGETTVKVMGKGKGGRNQTLVLASLPITDETKILAFDTDGVDYYHFGGAIGDKETTNKAETQKLDYKKFLDEDNSFEFFDKTGDGIFTDKLKSNVADLIMVLKI